MDRETVCLREKVLLITGIMVKEDGGQVTDCNADELERHALRCDPDDDTCHLGADPHKNM